MIKGDERQTIYLFETFTNSDSIINKLCNIVTQKLKCEEIEYNIKFSSCLCQLTTPERQKITRKHKSTTQIKLIANKRKEEYADLERVKKE